MKNIFAVFSLLVLGNVTSFTASSQVKFGNNVTTINTGSLLELESTNKGLLFPRVSLSATTAWGLAGTAAAGMCVYNNNAAITGTATYPTTGAGIYYFDGTGWVSINAKIIAAEPWFNAATGTGATGNTQNIYQMGNVGIGTTNPGNLLDVVGTDAMVSARVKGQLSVETNSGNLAQIKLINTAASGHTWYLGNVWGAAEFGLRDITAGAYRFLIDGNGNVGIGTTAPGAKLEVSNNATGVNSVIIRSSGANSNGIYAEATGGGGNAGYFNASGTSNGSVGYAISGLGVYGQSTNSYGMYGRTLSPGVAGVIGFAANNVTYGMLGFNNQYSLYGNGDISISGTLAKGAGTFKVDHPQDPANKYLIHSFVESPDMMNVYNGNIVTDENGEAIVQLPDYFLSLNKEFRYQLTAIGTFAQAIVAEEINTSNEFKIKTDKPNVKISWQVTGIRQDPYANAHRIKDVEAKMGAEKGKYIHPELYNQPAEKSIFYKNSPKADKTTPE